MDDVFLVCSLPASASDGDVRLAYGQRADGTIAHISEVTSGLACECVCPGCGVDLVARRGDAKEHHFAHRSSAQCAHAVESALHKLAKEVLHERREILLPEVSATREGRTLVTHPADIHRFDDAVLEQRLDAIVPDVIVRKGAHRLLVEMFVTHRCGPEKIELIRQMGLSCVEIDLRQISRRATRMEVERALLADAHRYWLNNPKLDHAATSLVLRIEQEREEARLAALAAQVENERRLDRLAEGIRRHRAKPSPRMGNSSTPVVLMATRHGFGDHVGQVLEGAECFRCPAEVWQAEIVDRFVIAPLDQRFARDFDFSAGEALAHLKSCGYLAPGALGYVSVDDEAALAARVPGYRPPLRVVEAFLTRLELNEVLERLRRRRWAVSAKAKREWNERRKRGEELERWREDIRATVRRILQKASDQTHDDFDVDRWMRLEHPGIGTSFAKAFEEDDHRLTQLSFVVHQIDGMLSRNAEIVDDLFGLPVEHAVDREIAARRERAEAERLQQEDQARKDSDGRVDALATEAVSKLGHDAARWMDSTVSVLNGTPRVAAAAGWDGLNRARSALALRMKDVEHARSVDRLRSRLLSAAAQMRRPEHARLFLTSPHPNWRGGHPIDACIDERTFEDLKRQMTKVGG